MNDPHQVLGLRPDADEASVRKRYLELVRQHPPDTAPEQFARFRAAYDELREPARLMEKRILEVSDDSLDDIIADVRSRLRLERIPVETLLSLGEG